MVHFSRMDARLRFAARLLDTHENNKAPGMPEPCGGMLALPAGCLHRGRARRELHRPYLIWEVMYLTADFTSSSEAVEPPLGGITPF